jgi:hypothetical protein
MITRGGTCRPSTTVTYHHERSPASDTRAASTGAAMIAGDGPHSLRTPGVVVITRGGTCRPPTTVTCRQERSRLHGAGLVLRCETGSPVNTTGGTSRPPVAAMHRRKRSPAGGLALPAPASDTRLWWRGHDHQWRCRPNTADLHAPPEVIISRPRARVCLAGARTRSDQQRRYHTATGSRHAPLQAITTSCEESRRPAAEPNLPVITTGGTSRPLMAAMHRKERSPAHEGSYGALSGTESPCDHHRRYLAGH